MNAALPLPSNGPLSHCGPCVSQRDRQSRSQALGADEESLLFDDWQREVEPEEAELLEDERPVAGGDRETEGGGDAREDIRQDVPERPKEKDGRRRADMGLPFLTGVSPAGFLSANRKQPGETDHVVKVGIRRFLSSPGIPDPDPEPVCAHLDVPAGEWEVVSDGEGAAGEDGGPPPSQPAGRLPDGPRRLQQEVALCPVLGGVQASPGAEFRSDRRPGLCGWEPPSGT